MTLGVSRKKIKLSAPQFLGTNANSPYCKRLAEKDCNFLCSVLSCFLEDKMNQTYAGVRGIDSQNRKYISSDEC